MIRLSVTVMTASFDTERRLSVENLIREIHPETIKNLTIDFQIISDWWKSGPWPTAKRCWEHGVRIDGTHHMILQDDITVCDDFLLGVHEVIRACPDSPISLYANRKICEQAKEQDARWVRIPDGIWGPAVIMPTDHIPLFLSWEAQHIKPSFKHDDSRLAMWCVKTGNSVMCPQPSLVQHKAAQKSLLGQSHPSKVARWFERQTPLSRDWKSGAVLDAPNGLSKGYYDYYIER
jgi:hypothetical protein